MIKSVPVIFCVTAFALLCSCKKSKKENDTAVKKVYKDSLFDQRFEMYGPGFTGGDATYSVPLPDGRIVWIFGDTFIGPITPELTRKKTDPLYIRNCFVMQQGEQMNILHQGKHEEFKSMIIPMEVENGEKTELDIWFWPGDGFVQDNKLKVFLSKFHQAKKGMWGFEFIETVLVEYSLPDLTNEKKIKIPYSKKNGVHYGHSLYEDEDFLYVYGLGNGKPHVARTKYAEISTYWEFFDGMAWTSDPKLSKPMVEINGSEQFSVLKLRNKYVLITQYGGLSRKVYSFISETPYGPWEKEQLLFETPIAYPNQNLFTYNALAHPQFTSKDNLLVSYNTNSMELEDHFTNAGIYRPRFMRVPIDMIFKK